MPNDLEAAIRKVFLIYAVIDHMTWRTNKCQELRCKLNTLFYSAMLRVLYFKPQLAWQYINFLKFRMYLHLGMHIEDNKSHLFSLTIIVSILAITALSKPKIPWPARDVIFSDYQTQGEFKFDSFERNYWWRFTVYDRKTDSKVLSKGKEPKWGTVFALSQSLECQPSLRRAQR